VENIFVEILAQSEINLYDPYSAFVVIVDLETRILFY
jgi:hypothetical protein